MPHYLHHPAISRLAPALAGEFEAIYSTAFGISAGHHREFLNGIQTGEECSCNFAYGHKLTTVGHLGNIALWTGDKLKWDAKAERITNHEDANKHLVRQEYRAPWSLPKV